METAGVILIAFHAAERRSNTSKREREKCKKAVDFEERARITILGKRIKR